MAEIFRYYLGDEYPDSKSQKTPNWLIKKGSTLKHISIQWAQLKDKKTLVKAEGER